MAAVTLEEAQKQLQAILDQSANGKVFSIQSEHCTYHITVKRELTTQPAERIPDLHLGSFTMSENFNDEDPVINALFYGNE